MLKICSVLLFFFFDRNSSHSSNFSDPFLILSFHLLRSHLKLDQCLVLAKDALKRNSSKIRYAHSNDCPVFVFAHWHWLNKRIICAVWFLFNLNKCMPDDYYHLLFFSLSSKIDCVLRIIHGKTIPSYDLSSKVLLCEHFFNNNKHINIY